MFKAKEVSVNNVAIFLMVSLLVSAGYFVARQLRLVSSSVPVFMGEEVMAQKTAVRPVVKAVAVSQAVAAPLPAPKPAMPMPIVPPTITFKVLPVYPAAALRQGLEGFVILSAYINLNGQVEKVETKAPSGTAAFDEAAQKAVAQWRFSPATQGGATLSSWYEIPVRFTVK